MISRISRIERMLRKRCPICGGPASPSSAFHRPIRPAQALDRFKKHLRRLRSAEARRDFFASLPDDEKEAILSGLGVDTDNWPEDTSAEEIRRLVRDAALRHGLLTATLFAQDDRQ